MIQPDEHTLTPAEIQRMLRDGRRKRAKTDEVVARSRQVTAQLAEVNENPDHVIERLRAIIQGV